MLRSYRAFAAVHPAARGNRARCETAAGLLYSVASLCAETERKPNRDRTGSPSGRYRSIRSRIGRSDRKTHWHAFEQRVEASAGGINCLVKITQMDNHEQKPTQNQCLSPSLLVHDCWFSVDRTSTKQAQRMALRQTTSNREMGESITSHAPEFLIFFARDRNKQ